MNVEDIIIKAKLYFEVNVFMNWNSECCKRQGREVLNPIYTKMRGMINPGRLRTLRQELNDIAKRWRDEGNPFSRSDVTIPEFQIPKDEDIDIDLFLDQQYAKNGFAKI